MSLFGKITSVVHKVGDGIKKVDKIANSDFGRAVLSVVPGGSAAQQSLHAATVAAQKASDSVSAITGSNKGRSPMASVTASSSSKTSTSLQTARAQANAKALAGIDSKLASGRTTGGGAMLATRPKVQNSGGFFASILSIFGL